MNRVLDESTGLLRQAVQIADTHAWRTGNALDARTIQDLAQDIHAAIAGRDARIEELESEEVRLRKLIDDAAAHWMRLQHDHPIVWEGAIDGAMEAACARIVEHEQRIESERPDPETHVRVRIAVVASREGWTAAGWHDEVDAEALRDCHEEFNDKEVRESFVEAWVPKPEKPATVEGEVSK